MQTRKKVEKEYQRNSFSINPFICGRLYHVEEYNRTEFGVSTMKRGTPAGLLSLNILHPRYDTKNNLISYYLPMCLTSFRGIT
jgi:hypothetical protein